MKRAKLAPERMFMSSVRDDFPIFEGNNTIYFDNAATTQRPRQVIKAMQEFNDSCNANPLRGLYEWSVKATDAYEDARHDTAQFIGAERDCEIVFTRNTTESINLMAYSYGLTNIHEGDEIVVSASADAKSVETRNDNDDLILSDNFSDLNGGEKRVKILKGKADGLQVRSVYDIR